MRLPDNRDMKEFLEQLKERHRIEFKKAENNLPRSFWETYSAFSNTEGGHIILGVAENKPTNTIVGVSQPDKVIADLWNMLSNREKVNYSTINNPDVSNYVIDGKTIIIIKVNEAPENMKPIYLNGKIENAYIRTGEGDRQITDDQLRAFLRNAKPDMDSLYADSITYADLDPISVISFKEKVSIRYPKKQFETMSPEEFLNTIGAAKLDRKKNYIRIKKGALLFLGKYNSIREQFPHFHMDYLNRKGSNRRWTDRIATDEPHEFERNIYNFYNIVSEKLRTLLQERFELDTQQLRLKTSDFDETIREALVNCLAHADYSQNFPSIKIEAFDGWFQFVNPGKMLVSVEAFANGGNSRPRNEVIMSLFRLLGASERQGFGGHQIFRSAIENQYRPPEIETDLERTDMKIWYIDLADSYPDMSPDEKEIFRLIVKTGIPVSNKEIQKATDFNDYRVRKSLDSLIHGGHVRTTGKARSTKYTIKIDSPELITRLLIAVDDLQKSMK